MGENGELQAEAVIDEDGRLVLRIRDNGPGISREQQERLFDPFYTTRKDGTGLGLAVVQAIARAHKGEVTLESEPGRGSIFSMHLPVFQSLREHEHPAAVPASARPDTWQIA